MGNLKNVEAFECSSVKAASKCTLQTSREVSLFER